MTVKILIKRRVAPEHVVQLSSLLKKLRGMALSQPGYVNGETMRRLDARNEFLVISTWHSQEAWEAWLNNDRRKEVQNEIEALLDERTEYAVYEE
ncbi:MAG: antibiotic biosynthesis monooxygenase family protein [Desulfoprunum sp.]|jgi:quinol monooxygenase YgiN|uniref:antibiotic biosynthesis monooxygenase family protein n=1 Tax=Desulfoprunum sp. TaxID=2020866 RepID=UPI00052DD7C1|nr:hypothetical protein JT06_04040 [Desulfobulbus sp. Tol-SR]